MVRGWVGVVRGWVGVVREQVRDGLGMGWEMVWEWVGGRLRMVRDK